MDTRKTIKQAARLLSSLGFELEQEQPHLTGHRVMLVRNKFVLVGKQRANNQRVIIKMSDDSSGKKEIHREKEIRDALFNLHASKVSKSLPKVPATIYFGQHDTYLLIVTEFIHQERMFVAHPVHKQHAFLVRALKDREKLATTVSDWPKKEKAVFATFRTKDYVANFESFLAAISKNYPIVRLKETIEDGLKLLKTNAPTMRSYENYFIHSDFIPHNLRINNNNIILLDCIAMHFGNKYEELARFLNYMLLHSPALERRMAAYILKSRGKGEYLDLKLMRIYKLGFLLEYYAGLLPKASDYLLPLVIYRLDFWEEALRCILQDRPVNKKIQKIFFMNDVLLTSKQEVTRRREYGRF